MNNKKYEISVDTYNSCLRTFQTIEDRFGINVLVDDKDDLLDKGQIFVFNHFARFEAVIPIYFIYKATGAFTRTIADKSLFNMNEKFDNFLYSGGAVPNNLEGLLPFLAAEILRGRKVVIFPEGGLVKTRNVFHKKHGFQLLSGLAERTRKQHRGAAVLALTLDLFKERIKDLHERGDIKRLEHWRDALEIESIEKLLEETYKPTLICPGNITFYPLRIKKNIISRAVNFFIKKMPDQLNEEIIIESNIIFKNTDMSVQFKKSINVHRKLNWWRKLLLRHFFHNIDSLDEFFTLSQTKDSLLTRFLVRFMYTETNSIRDEYMEQTYINVTLNTSHVAATLLTKLHKHHKETIAKADFEQLVKDAIDQLKREPHLHLHHSLQGEITLADIAKELKIFYETIEYAELADVGRKEIFIKDAIADHEHDVHQFRLKNPVQVFVNEATPVQEVRRACLLVLRHMNKKEQKELIASAKEEGAIS